MLETSRDVSYQSRCKEEWLCGGGGVLRILRGVISNSLFLTGFVKRLEEILKLL